MSTWSTIQLDIVEKIIQVISLQTISNSLERLTSRGQDVVQLVHPLSLPISKAIGTLGSTGSTRSTKGVSA